MCIKIEPISAMLSPSKPPVSQFGILFDCMMQLYQTQIVLAIRPVGIAFALFARESKQTDTP